MKDVWSSVNDGRSWTLVTSSPPWTARLSFASVVIYSNIIIFGGQGASSKLLFILLL